MELEKKFIDYVANVRFEDLPKRPVEIVKTIILTHFGCLAAGAAIEGSQNVVDLVKYWRGREEATVLIHGFKAPAYNTAFLNSTMSRALDFDDAIVPGLHGGSIAVPVGLAAAEIVGGCSGKEFLASLVAGIELMNRLNMINRVVFYDGFKATGVCGILGSTAIAGRILGLNSDQMSNALGLAFNRAGGSQQSNIDGVQAVGLVPGFTAQNSVICAQLAQRGVTGPPNFLQGPFGWFHLYGRGKFDGDAIAGELGTRFELTNTIFKKFPCCGLAQTSTQAMLELVQEGNLTPDNVARIDITLGPFAQRLLGHFAIGDSPRVNAQFSSPYCAASALLRKSALIVHFEESSIRDPRIVEIVKKIKVSSDPKVEERAQGAVEMKVTTTSGVSYHKRVDFPFGFPGREMTREEHIAAYRQCVSYGSKPLVPANAERLLELVDRLEEVSNVCDLIPLMISASGSSTRVGRGAGEAS